MFVVAVVSVLGLLLSITLPRTQGKDIAFRAAIKDAASAVSTANKVMDTVRPFIKDSVSANIMDKVLAMAQEGVKSAEQLYVAGHLPADERKLEANKFVVAALRMADIDITPDLERLVDSAIESKVFDLGH